MKNTIAFIACLLIIVGMYTAIRPIMPKKVFYSTHIIQPELKIEVIDGLVDTTFIYREP